MMPWHGGPDEGGLPDIEDLTGRPSAAPEDVERALRSGLGEELPPRRREPQLDGDPEAVAAVRQQLGL